MSSWNNRVHDNLSKDTSSNTTISLQRPLVYYDMLSNATHSTYDIWSKKNVVDSLLVVKMDENPDFFS